MQQYLKIFLFSFLVLLLPGCKQYFFWGKESFVQAPKVRIDISQARASVQTKRLYDQAATVGIFDLLWLSDEVRTAAVDLKSYWKAFSQEERSDLLKSEMEENNETVSLYLLMGDAPSQRLSLKTNESGWSVSLKTAQGNFKPLSIKCIELSPEYKKIFGARANHFRVPYLVRFDRYDNSGNDLIAGSFSFVLSTVTYTVNFDLPFSKQNFL